MECSKAKAILFEYADTDIPAEFREEVEAHLAVCRSCASQLEALKEQSDALRTLAKVEAPTEFLGQVRSRLEKPPVLSRFKDRLSVLFAGKRFFQVAGAAAMAVLVMATAQVVLRESGHKTLLSPAESPPPVGSPPSVEAPAPSPARPQSLPEIRRENKKALNRAATEAKLRPSPGIEAQSVSLTLKLPGASPRVKSRGGGFKPENMSASSPSAGAHAPGAGRVEQDVSKGAAGSSEVSEGSPAPEAQKIASDVIRMIERANGKVLSAGPARDPNQPGTLLAEMPAANYHAFLDQLRQLGEIEFKGDKEFSPAPDAKVRVSVGFATRD
jgi:hypothetical protein